MKKLLFIFICISVMACKKEEPEPKDKDDDKEQKSQYDYRFLLTLVGCGDSVTLIDDDPEQIFIETGSPTNLNFGDAGQAFFALSLSNFDIASQYANNDSTQTGSYSFGDSSAGLVTNVLLMEIDTNYFDCPDGNIFSQQKISSGIGEVNITKSDKDIIEGTITGKYAANFDHWFESDIDTVDVYCEFELEIWQD